MLLLLNFRETRQKKTHRAIRRTFPEVRRDEVSSGLRSPLVDSHVWHGLPEGRWPWSGRGPGFPLQSTCRVRVRGAAPGCGGALRGPAWPVGGRHGRAERAGEAAGGSGWWNGRSWSWRWRRGDGEGDGEGGRHCVAWSWGGDCIPEVRLEDSEREGDTAGIYVRENSFGYRRKAAGDRQTPDTAGQ